MPAAPAAPPPAKPSTAPPAAPKADPTTQPGSASPGDKNLFESEFKELESLDDAPKPEPKAQKKVEIPKQQQKPEAPKEEPEHEDEDLPPENEKEVDKPVQQQKPEREPKSVPELRRGYEAKKKEIKEVWEPKVKTLESELEKLKSDTTGQFLQEENAKLKKRNEELERGITFSDFKKSAKYVEQYEKPYNEKWASVVNELKELTVKEKTGVNDLGEPIYTERVATPEDMLVLCNLPLGQAWKRAKEMFGDTADEMMAHRRSIRELSDAQNKALESAQKNASEMENQRKLDMENYGKQRNELWNSANNHLSTKFPKWFAKEDGDEEGNTILEKGFTWADRLFNPKEEDKPKDLKEAMALQALVRNKAANHDRLAYRLKKAAARIAELEKSLAEYEKSEPAGGETGNVDRNGKPTDWRTSYEQEIDALDQ